MDPIRGFKAAREYPLWDAIFRRRSRRVAAGAAFRSGTLSFQSALPPQPLSRLELSGALPRHRFGRPLDAVPPHRS